MMNRAPTYAAGTKVPIEQSKAEVERLLRKHGATQIGSAYDEEALLAVVAFTLEGLRYRIEVPMPAPIKPNEVRKLAKSPARWSSMDDARRLDWCARYHDQECRERWRGLLLLVKAKLEIVRMKVSTFEKEFLADLVLPNNATAGAFVGEYMKRLVSEGYKGPLQLPGPSAP